MTSPPLQWRQLAKPLDDGARVLVLACDMCSSSDILEDLTASGRMDEYRLFISRMKHDLVDLQHRHLFFHPYKFTGDGWILLFPRNDTLGKGVALLELMRMFSERFREAFGSMLREYLSRPRLPLPGSASGWRPGPYIPREFSVQMNTSAGRSSSRAGCRGSWECSPRRRRVTRRSLATAHIESTSATRALVFPSSSMPPR